MKYYPTPNYEKHAGESPATPNYGITNYFKRINMKEIMIKAYGELINKETKTMKSTDLHGFIYEATGKFKELKNFHNKIREVMTGTKTPTDAQISEGFKMKPTLRANKQVKYFNLDEVECNMILASIDVRHLRLMAEVFVAVKDTLHDDKIRLEIKELAEKIDMERIKGHVEIAKMMQEINKGFDPMAYFDEVGIKSVLPANLSLSLTNAMSDIRPNVPAYSATELIKDHKLSIRTPEFNNFIAELELLEEYEVGGSIKKRFRHDSNWFGYNRHQSSTTKYPVTPFFYKDRSIEVVNLLRERGYEI